MQSETGFQSSHQLKSYVSSKSRLKLAARAVLSADAGLLVHFVFFFSELKSRYTTLLLNGYDDVDAISYTSLFGFYSKYVTCPMRLV